MALPATTSKIFRSALLLGTSASSKPRSVRGKPVSKPASLIKIPLVDELLCFLVIAFDFPADL
jgi:hypothetical protein